MWRDVRSGWTTIAAWCGTNSSASGSPWWALPAGFALFRLFDVAKPWPIGWLDRRLKGGLGVMADDAVAGVFAAVVLWLLLGWL